MSRGATPHWSLGGEPIRPAPLVHGRQKGQPHTVDLDNGRRRGFVQVHAGPEMPESKFIEQASQLLESAVKAVKGMIVGQRKDVETRRRNRTDKLGRADDPRLGRNTPAVAGERELQVGEQHVALGKDRADSRRNQFGIATVRESHRDRCRATGRQRRQDVLLVL